MRITAIVFSFLLASTALAQSASEGHKLLGDIQALAQKCVTHPYTLSPSGEKIFNGYRNSCSQIEVLNSFVASITINGQTVLVKLQEAEDSDGGDLNHLLVYDADGKLLDQEQNILAFNNILLALLGGEPQSETVEVEATSAPF